MIAKLIALDAAELRLRKRLAHLAQLPTERHVDVTSLYLRLGASSNSRSNHLYLLLRELRDMWPKPVDEPFRAGFDEEKERRHLRNHLIELAAKYDLLAADKTTGLQVAIVLALGRDSCLNAAQELKYGTRLRQQA